MKLKDIREIFRNELGHLYPAGEIDSFFYLLTEHYMGLEKFVLVIDPSFAVTHKDEQPLFEALSLLKEEYPIQYIVGKTEFMDLRIRVNEHVLIPRPETEELVRWILDCSTAGGKRARILDIGTGSGCIAIALAKNLPEASVHGTDVSGEALALASDNAAMNGVEITFIKSDILKQRPEGGKWDIIVSNPPYVMEKEKEAMRNNVKRYEPANALFVPDTSPLVFLEHIADLAMEQLNPGGEVYFEINQYLANESRQLLENRNFSEITLRKDLFGNQRMLMGKLPKPASGNNDS
jgi:release factor glutamine methyltransferase